MTVPFIVYALAVWSLARLITHDSLPGVVHLVDWLDRTAARLGWSPVSKLIACTWCHSMWVALALGYLLDIATGEWARWLGLIVYALAARIVAGVGTRLVDALDDYLPTSDDDPDDEDAYDHLFADDPEPNDEPAAVLRLGQDRAS